MSRFAIGATTTRNKVKSGAALHDLEVHSIVTLTELGDVLVFAVRQYCHCKLWPCSCDCVCTGSSTQQRRHAELSTETNAVAGALAAIQAEIQQLQQTDRQLSSEISSLTKQYCVCVVLCYGRHMW